LNDLVAKNVAAKGGGLMPYARLQSVRPFDGKMLVNEGQIPTRYAETKKRPERSSDRNNAARDDGGGGL